MKKSPIRLFRIFLLTIALSVDIISCNSNEHSAKDIELTIIPSSGGDTGYRISARNGNLISTQNAIIARDTTFLLGEVLQDSTTALSEEQSSLLDKLLQRVVPLDDHNSREYSALDTWIYTISINNLEYGKFSSESLLKQSEVQNEENVRQIVSYMLKLCPLKLDLRTFS
jgi:hypothetical protein